jgi:hemoglobin-like flavoprotein
MGLDVVALRESFELVVGRAPDLAHRFYDIFFARYPQVRPMFVSRSRDAQEKMLTGALVAVLDHLEDAPWLESQLQAMGAKHVGYGVRDEMYAWVGECLVATLKGAAGEAWTPRVEKAWGDAFGAISGLMLAGAKREREGAMQPA